MIGIIGVRIAIVIDFLIIRQTVAIAIRVVIVQPPVHFGIVPQPVLVGVEVEFNQHITQGIGLQGKLAREPKLVRTNRGGGGRPGAGGQRKAGRRQVVQNSLIAMPGHTPRIAKVARMHFQMRLQIVP